MDELEYFEAVELATKRVHSDRFQFVIHHDLNAFDAKTAKCLRRQLDEAVRADFERVDVGECGVG